MEVERLQRLIESGLVKADSKLVRGMLTAMSINEPMERDFLCLACGRQEHGSVGGGQFCSRECEENFNAEAHSALRQGGESYNAEARMTHNIAAHLAGRPVKLENIGKTTRQIVEGELLTGDFLETVRQGIIKAAGSPTTVLPVLEQLGRMIDRLQLERGAASDQVRAEANAARRSVEALTSALHKTEQRERDAVGRANTLQAEQESSERRWRQVQHELLERIKHAEDEVQPRRLQAKVREQWPTIESELEYFLEWFVREHNVVTGPNRVDAPEVVRQYVAATKEDGRK
jgi:hypothetical protein